MQYFFFYASHLLVGFPCLIQEMYPHLYESGLLFLHRNDKE